MLQQDKGLIARYSSLLLFGLCMLVFCGCNRTLKTKPEILSYINDKKNGLVKFSQSNEVDCKVTFLPWQTQAYNNDLLKLAVDQKTKSALKTKYYFLISLSKDNKEILRQLKSSEYSEMVQVLAFRMTDFVKVKLGSGKTLEPLNCLFQQTYGLSNANELLVVFEESEFEKAETFKIYISEFGLGTGNLSFLFNRDQIQKLQHLLQP